MELSKCFATNKYMSISHHKAQPVPRSHILSQCSTTTNASENLYRWRQRTDQLEAAFPITSCASRDQKWNSRSPVQRNDWFIEGSKSSWFWNRWRHLQAYQILVWYWEGTGGCYYEAAGESLKGSEFIGIIIDKTVSITVENKLIVYAKIEYKGKIEMSFLGNYNVHSGPAQCKFEKVVEVLRGREVELSRVMGLGSDGANMLDFVLSSRQRIPSWFRCTVFLTELHWQLLMQQMLQVRYKHTQIQTHCEHNPFILKGPFKLTKYIQHLINALQDWFPHPSEALPNPPSTVWWIIISSNSLGHVYFIPIGPYS